MLIGAMRRAMDRPRATVIYNANLWIAHGAGWYSPVIFRGNPWWTMWYWYICDIQHVSCMLNVGPNYAPLSTESLHCYPHSTDNRLGAVPTGSSRTHFRTPKHPALARRRAWLCDAPRDQRNRDLSWITRYPNPTLICSFRNVGWK